MYTESVRLGHDLSIEAATPGTVTFDLGGVPSLPMFELDNVNEVAIRDVTITGQNVVVPDGTEGAFARVGFARFDLERVSVQNLSFEVAEGSLVEGLLIGGPNGFRYAMRDVDVDGFEIRFVAGPSPGAAWVHGGLVSSDYYTVLENVTVDGFRVTNDPGVDTCVVGGGVFYVQSSIWIQVAGHDVVVTDPVIDLDCRESITGPLVDWHDSDLTFDALTVTGAQVTLRGEEARGGGVLGCNCGGTLDNVEIAGSDIDIYGDVAQFDGLMDFTSVVEVSHVALHDNVISTDNPAGTAGVSFAFARIDRSELSWVDVRNNTITGSYVASPFYLTGSLATPAIRNAVIAGNQIGGPGTTYVKAGLVDVVGRSGAAVVSQVDIVGNTIEADEIDGGLFYVYASPGSNTYDHELRNINIVDNTVVAGLATGLLVRERDQGFSFRYLNAFGNTFDPALGDAYAFDPAAGEGLLSVDPLYVDVGSPDPNLWDLTLGAGSPAIDAGHPADLDADGSACDLGAYGGGLGGGW